MEWRWIGIGMENWMMKGVKEGRFIFAMDREPLHLPK